MIIIEPSHIIVDAINGDDMTAQRACASRPFQTLKAALGLVEDSDTVLVYPGRYSIEPKTCNLTALKDVTIRGLGNPVLKMTDHGTGILINGCLRTTIEGLELQGCGPLLTPNSLYFAAVQHAGINDGTTVRRCRFEGWGNHGIAHLDGPRTSDNGLYEDNTFINGGNYNHATLRGDGAAIAIGGWGTTIRGNRIVNWLRGIEVEASEPGHSTNDVVVENNRISECPGWSICVIPTHGNAELFARHRYSGNIINGLPPGAMVPPNSGAQCGIYFGGGVGAIISDNLVTDIGNGNGIALIASWSDVREVVASGNQITRANRHSLCVSPGAAGKASNCTLLSNRISHGAGRGIYVEGEGNFISGNHVTDCDYVGVHIVGGATNGSATNCCQRNKLRVDDTLPSPVTSDPWIV